jgi:transposase-like protein
MLGIELGDSEDEAFWTAFLRQLREQVFTMLNEMFPAAAALMAQSKEDGLAFRDFPTEHWRKIGSTNLLEQINKKIKRRTSLVGIFANNAAIIRLVGALLLEQQIGTADWNSRRTGMKGP